MKKLARYGFRLAPVAIALLFLGGYVAYAMGFVQVDPAWLPWNAPRYARPAEVDPTRPRQVLLVMDEEAFYQIEKDRTWARVKIDPKRLGQPRGHVHRREILRGDGLKDEGKPRLTGEELLEVWHLAWETDGATTRLAGEVPGTVPMAVSTKSIGTPIFSIRRDSLFPKLANQREADDLLSVWAVWYIPATGEHLVSKNAFDEQAPSGKLYK
jgi:hypothetical protein